MKGVAERKKSGGDFLARRLANLTDHYEYSVTVYSNSVEYKYTYEVKQ